MDHHDSKIKGKEKQESHHKNSKDSTIIIAPDQTLPPPPSSSSSSSSPTQQQKPSLDLNLTPPPSSTAPELIQEAKRLKLTLNDHQPDSSFTDPPTSSSSGPIDTAQQKDMHLNPAQLRIQLSEEGSRGLFRLARQRATLRKEYKVFPAMVTRTRPGPSPLGPNHPSPYDIVKQVLSDMKQFLNNYSAHRASIKPDRPPKPPPFSAWQPLPPPVVSSSGILTMEEVIVMMDEYVEGMSKTVSADEMEEGLEEFKRRVGIVVDVDEDESSWYGLMKNSRFEFWEKMSDHFVCETMESDDDDDENDDGEDTSED